MACSRSRGLSAAALATTAICLLGGPVQAQDAPEEAVVTPEYVVDVPDVEARDKEGWLWNLALATQVSFNDNRGVVGEVDGSSATLGYKFGTTFDYFRNQHGFRSSLVWTEGLTKTPALDAVVKSEDNFLKESIYSYYVTPYFGPFGRLSLETPLFRGDDVRPAPTTYAITHTDGTVETVVRRRLPLTDYVRPLTLKQSIGPFLRPARSDDFNLEFRVGLAGRETLAEDQLAVDDDDATEGIIEVTELRDVYQMGVEFVASTWGHLEGETFTYKAGFEVMTPFLTNDVEDRTSGELTNLEANLGLSFRLTSFASLDYELRAKREPQLIDVLQLQNNLLLSLGVGMEVDKRREIAPAPDPGAAPAPAPDPAAPPAPATSD
jgi:hypothetical protein